MYLVTGPMPLFHKSFHVPLNLHSRVEENIFLDKRKSLEKKKKILFQITGFALAFLSINFDSIVL